MGTSHGLIEDIKQPELLNEARTHRIRCRGLPVSLIVVDEIKFITYIDRL